jgi:hypothetical protein
MRDSLPRFTIGDLGLRIRAQTGERDRNGNAAILLTKSARGCLEEPRRPRCKASA